MPLPQPPVALDDICSVVFNNTLYTYSEKAFQALSLTPGGNWTQLPQGEQVAGAVCVGSTPGDPNLAGLYVVGGKGSNTTYQGLQKFTYSTGKWESITLQAPVTQERLWHGAIYLNASDTIFMYAGQQDGTQNPSTQTYTIGASAPYLVTSHPYATAAPPTINPILLTWSASQAVLVGGSTTNKQVSLFSPETDWVDSGASLAEPFEKDTTSVQAMLVTGDDGSKNLYAFDMTVSPNTVTRTLLVDGSGQAVQNSPQLRTRSDLVEKRSSSPLIEGDWPEYNSTLAPKATRTNYALAQDPNSLVVIAGGNEDDILCMFDARENSWQNATARLQDPEVFSIMATSTSTSSSTSRTSTPTSSPTSAATASVTATPTPTPTAVAVAPTTAASKLGTNAVLGIIFGSVFGVAILLALIYMWLMRRRSHQAHSEAGHVRRSSGQSSVEKDSIIFANDSMAHHLTGPGAFRGHQQQNSATSFSSMAILMGKVNQSNHQNPPGLKRNPSEQTKRTSTSSIFNKAFKSTISKPIPQMRESITPIDMAPPRAPPGSRDEKGVAFAANTAEPRTRNLTGGARQGTDQEEETRRSSGWNRYWSGGSALNILGFGSGNGNGGGPSRSSGPRLTPNPKRMTVESDMSSEYSSVSPNRITQDSATVPPLHIYEPRASFSQVARGSPTISSYTSNLKEGMSGHIERPISAVSDLSAYSSGIPASVHEAWDPTLLQKPWGTARAPSSAYSSVYATSLAPATAPLRPARPEAQAQGPTPIGVSNQPQLKQAATSSDMSWLNLGN